MKTRDRIDTTDYAALVRQHDTIDPALYDTYQVKRGLRDLNGKGVVAGLTNISRIDAFDAEEKPADGKLWYRGYEIHDLVENQRALHPDLCHCKGCRLERPPHRGALLRIKDHPSCL